MMSTTSAYQNSLAKPIEIPKLKSWLPIDAVIVEGRPGIEWMEMPGVEFTEPFFHQTVARVRKERAAEIRITGLEELIRVEKIADSLAPSGFIFHSSRCGSTLVANACKALRGSVVISEAPVLDKLISRFFTDCETREKELLYSAFLRGAMSALGQRRFGTERHVFVKFACSSILQFQRIRKIWPRVPALFLYRHPVDVIVSNLENIPEWMTIDSNPAVSAAIVGVEQAELASLGQEEFCARALGRFYSAAGSILDENLLLVNYADLSPGTLPRLISYFRISISAGEATAIMQVARRYSKDSSRAFTAEDRLKKENASIKTREMAERWAVAAYQRLVELQRQTVAAFV